MAKQYFVPRRDNKLFAWLKVFRQKIVSYAATFGLSPSDVSDIQTACDDLVNDIQDVAAKKTAYKSAVAKKKAQRKKTLKILTRYINRFKTNINYSEGIGIVLGVVGSEAEFVKNEYKPKLRGRAMGGYVRIDYNKEKIDSIKMYSKLENQGDDKWVMIGQDTNPPFFDKRPLTVARQPEAREYRAIGIVNDELTGQWSDIITVLYNGGA